MFRSREYGDLTLVREGRTEILVEPGFREWLQERGIARVEAIIEQAEIDPNLGGRRDCRLFRPKGTENQSFVIRPYVHGGLLRRLLGQLFLLGSRPFQEMMATREASRRGVPTVRAVAALHRRTWGPFYHGELITREIPGAVDLVSFFSGRGMAPSRAMLYRKRETIRRAGRVVRLMHERGIYHHDLNLKNLVVQAPHRGDPLVYVIDFDRARIQPSLSIRLRVKNLLRLDRSTEKWKAKGLPISSMDKARFFRAYTEGNLDILRAMKLHLRKTRIRTIWHRLGWGLDRLLNP